MTSDFSFCSISRRLFSQICNRVTAHNWCQNSVFLAHLSWRLMGELTGYPWSGVSRRPSTISNVFLSETDWPISQILCGPPWKGGIKVYINGPGHMTKMATMHIYGKNLKNLLQNQKSYDLETWHAVSGTRVLRSLCKWWPWVDLDLFYGKVKFYNLGFSIGKSENIGFFRTFCSQWPESW